jgi:hypothetical protein
MSNAGKALNGDEEGSFKDNLKQAVTDSSEASNKITDNLGSIGESAKTAFEDVAKQAANNFTNYTNKIDEYIKKNEALITSINNIILAYGEMDNLPDNPLSSDDFTSEGKSEGPGTENAKDTTWGGSSKNEGSLLLDTLYSGTSL